MYIIPKPNMIGSAIPWQVIRRFQTSAPVDVVGLSNALGVAVWESAELSPEVSGRLFFDRTNGGSTGYSIIINGSEPYQRKRFTVAHEIAHFLLHRDQIGNGLQDDARYQSGLPAMQEAEANGLAAEILMPQALIERLQNSGITDPDQLAQRLQVPREAMRVRLTALYSRSMSAAGAAGYTHGFSCPKCVMDLKQYYQHFWQLQK